jgi:hypothetical protein
MEVKGEDAWHMTQELAESPAARSITLFAVSLRLPERKSA